MGFGAKKREFILLALPAAPLPAAAKAAAKEDIKKKRRRLSQTILTSPGGILGPATVERKTLLGG